MSADDKMIARFTAERMKNHGKKSIFNLGGEETLTHFGKSLAEIERLDDDPRSDEEEDEESKRLDGKLGFITKITKLGLDTTTHYNDLGKAET